MSSDNPPPPNVPEQTTAPYPEGEPPKYSEAFPTPAYPPVDPGPAPVYGSMNAPAGGPPPGQQMHGPTPVPGPQPVTTTNYTARTTTYVRTSPMSEYPVQMVCSRCNQSVSTRISYVNGLLLWLAVGIICLFGGFLGCCLIPFCIDGCKDVAHTCPVCNEYLGTYKRL